MKLRFHRVKTCGKVNWFSIAILGNIVVEFGCRQEAEDSLLSWSGAIVGDHENSRAFAGITKLEWPYWRCEEPQSEGYFPLKHFFFSCHSFIWFLVRISWKFTAYCKNKNNTKTYIHLLWFFSQYSPSSENSQHWFVPLPT